MSEPTLTYEIVLRGDDGVIFWVLADVVGDRATALNMAWFALGHFRAASAELFAGDYAREGPGNWEDPTKLIAKITPPEWSSSK